MKEKKLSRRRFFKLSGLAAGGLAILATFRLIKDDIFAKKDSPSTALSRFISKGEIKIGEKKSSVFLSTTQCLKNLLDIDAFRYLLAVCSWIGD